jgi:hypothetical protein
MVVAVALFPPFFRCFVAVVILVITAGAIERESVRAGAD